MTMANMLRAQMDAAPQLAGNVAGQVLGAAAQLTEAIKAETRSATPVLAIATAAEQPPANRKEKDFKEKDHRS